MALVVQVFSYHQHLEIQHPRLEHLDQQVRQQQMDLIPLVNIGLLGGGGGGTWGYAGPQEQAGGGGIPNGNSYAGAAMGDHQTTTATITY